MPSKNYRYFCLDSTGRLHGVTWFHADSDEDAIAQIKAKHPGDKCEIWKDKRLIASLSPERLSA